MRRSLVLLATSLGICLLASCGSDALSKEEFLAQGDAVCAKLQADGEAVAPPTEEAALGGYLREIIGLAKGAREDFAALAPPEDGEPVQTALLDALDRSIETAEGAATAAEEGDTVTAGDLATQAAEQGGAADQQAQDYGFQTCGSEDA